MRVTYTKQFPIFYYGFISFVITGLILVSGYRFGSYLLKGNHRVLYKSASNAISAQAPAICNISADETITKCGTSAVLTVDNGYNPTWSTGATTPSITVTTSGQYWWQYIDMNHNTVNNGDFSAAGHTGFTSQYTYIPPNGSTGPFGALSAESYYTVTTNPHISHSSFSSFGDHTSGSGRMMVVNGAPQNNVTVWTQDITVEPNTSYIFSIWGASAIHFIPLVPFIVSV